MTKPIVERILLVAGQQNSGKSTQLRSMFRDPRLHAQRAKNGRRPRNIYYLSPDRRLLLLLNSPHERRDSFDAYVRKLSKHLKPGRWCIALATQVRPTRKRRVPGVAGVVAKLQQRLSPERIRVALLYPDQKGRRLKDIDELTSELQSQKGCEVVAINGRSKTANGLLLSDTFDFQ